ncbi:hypothetical protein [Roseicyclus sp.]|uniref:hypothetical protein n=1 Tax=Roseicyclus sp. TaxID=1914329 RepID=UPI003F9FCE21
MSHVTTVPGRSHRNGPRSVGVLFAAFLCQTALALADTHLIATEVAMRDGVALETFI